jgi:hypothetical protein
MAESTSGNSSFEAVRNRDTVLFWILLLLLLMLLNPTLLFFIMLLLPPWCQVVLHDASAMAAWLRIPDVCHVCCVCAVCVLAQRLGPNWGFEIPESSGCMQKRGESMARKDHL